MKNNKPLIRRTFSQERFDILIKKQRNGNATFNDLTELDEIVNRDPEIRESILEEMQEQHVSNNNQKNEKECFEKLAPKKNLLDKLKAFFNRFFTIETAGLKTVVWS